jgi:protein TonB
MFATVERPMERRAPAPTRTSGPPSGSASGRSLDELVIGRADVGKRSEAAVVGLAIAGAHLVGLWALMQVDAVRTAMRESAPTLIEFILPDTPPHPKPPPPAATPKPIPKPQPRPVIAVERPPVVAAPPFTVPLTVPISEPEPAVVTAAAPVETPPAPPAPPAPPPPAAPRVLPMTAVAYTVPPPIEVPMISRRLREAGTVWLRVRVGRDGSPQQISLQRSSGFARLDQQAQEAMRQARFKPQTEDGQPIEWIVTAPLQYEIE